MDQSEVHFRKQRSVNTTTRYAYSHNYGTPTEVPCTPSFSTGVRAFPNFAAVAASKKMVVCMIYMMTLWMT